MPSIHGLCNLLHKLSHPLGMECDMLSSCHASVTRLKSLLCPSHCQARRHASSKFVAILLLTARLADTRLQNLLRSSFSLPDSRSRVFKVCCDPPSHCQTRIGMSAHLSPQPHLSPEPHLPPEPVALQYQHIAKAGFIKRNRNKDTSNSLSGQAASW